MFKIYKSSKDYVKEEFQDIFTALAYARIREIECEIEYAYSVRRIATWTKEGGTTWHIGTPDLTSREAGFLLGIKHQMIRVYLREERLPGTKFGKAWMIRIEDLEEFSKIPRLSGVNLEK